MFALVSAIAIAIRLGIPAAATLTWPAASLTAFFFSDFLPYEGALLPSVTSMSMQVVYTSGFPSA